MAHATTGPQGGLAKTIAVQCALMGPELRRARRGEARAIHRARTASRRVRELLPVAAAALSGTGAERARRDVRRVTRALGAVREADVMLALFRDEAARHGWSPLVVARIERTLEARREVLRARMEAKLDAIDVAKVRARCRKISAALEASPALAVWERALARRLRRRANELAVAIDHAGSVYIPEALHAVRVAAKKLRYSLEVAGDASGAPVRAFVATLQETQDVLGRFHDLHVLAARIQGPGLPPRERAAALEVTRIVDTFERECREQHATFLKQRSLLSELARRVGPDLASWLNARKLPMIKSRAARPRLRQGVA